MTSHRERERERDHISKTPTESRRAFCMFLSDDGTIPLIVSLRSNQKIYWQKDGNNKMQQPSNSSSSSRVFFIYYVPPHHHLDQFQLQAQLTLAARSDPP